LITSGRGGALAYYRNVRGKFIKTDLHLPMARYDQTAVLPISDGKRGTELLLGQSNYESQSVDEAAGVPGVVGISPAARRGSIATVVSGDHESVGPLALADVYGDGRLDLFVGGRVLPGAYPRPVDSRLFRNTGSGFVFDSVNSALLREVGMISAAVFSDVNGDGWPDLILAPEWGSLRLFLNDHGRLHEATADWGLAGVVGRWNGVTTGDLDSDGRLDIVATSWGRNTLYRVDSLHPLYLYYGDLTGTRRLDMLEAQYDDRLKGIAPLAPLERLMSVIPAIRLSTRTYDAYAGETIQQVLGPVFLNAQRLTAATTDHTVFFNRGGRFEPVALPREAQLAPAFAALVADFDGDGKEDVFLSQNFYPMEIGTPRYDAGRGLLLRGDGAGGFTAVPGQVSGIAVYGDQRGAAFADYDQDGRVDLVVSQNGAETKLYHNERATPGLRVKLQGPAGNPRGIGTVLRLEYGTRTGPAREVHGGSGYWSLDGAVQVLGMDGTATAIAAQWPGGKTTETPVPQGAREVRLKAP
jgi:hypothetical protein